MEITNQLLTVNKYSRSGKKLNKVKGVVIHWVANPLSTAENNRNFFDNRKEGQSGYGSAHEIVGLKGEIVVCLPSDEMAYHVGSKTYTAEALKRLGDYPNDCTYGIEFCHPDASGKPNDITYKALVQRAAYWLKHFKINENDLWTHKQVVGWKDCPKYYVDHPDEWEKFKRDVANVLRPAKPKPTGKPPVSTPQVTGKVHVVKQGDTLSEIAQRYKTSVAKLSKINNIKDPSKISVGQVIKLPSI